MPSPKPITIKLTRTEATELRDFMFGSAEKLSYTPGGISLFHVVQKLDYELSNGKKGRP